MKIRIKNILYFFLLNYSHILKTDHHQIIQISMIKSGTHMLAKCISAFTNRTPIFPEEALIEVDEKKLNELINLPPDKFWVNHLKYDKKVCSLFNNIKIIFLYRDLRDLAISLAFMIQKRPEYTNINFDNLLLGPVIHDHISWTCQYYLPWLEEAKICKIQFENLIGPKGGGSIIAQFNEIKKLANYLEINISDQEIIKIADELFGGTITFREGKIGSWKKYFKNQHKKEFKKIAGKDLIKLGYAKSMQW